MNRGGVDASDAVRAGLCQRLNSDHRSYKVLMNVSGDVGEFAITPGDLRLAARELAEKLPCGQPDYLVGFAPGGIPITVALAYELEARALIAYKTRLSVPGELTWSEPHAFNATFYFYDAVPGTSMVLVDDEVDSGNTVCNAVRALRSRDVNVIGVASAIEVVHDGHSAGRQQLQDLGLTLTSLRKLDVADPANYLQAGS